jgi:type IV pilus assembly protein PilQ
MTPLIALLLAATAAETRVTGLTVAHVEDRTEVVIRVDGNVSVRDFMLDDGRLVLDLTGVPQPPRIDLRDFNRGGVRELRVAPFQPNVARIVIALAAPAAYDVVRDGSLIRVSFANPHGEFESWHHSLQDIAAGAAQQPQPQQRPQPQPAAQAVTPAIAFQPVAGRAPPERTVRVMFTNEPVTNVLSLFSEYAGRTILAAPDVQGKSITAELRGVPWDKALEAILDANNMTMRLLPSGVYLVEDFARAGQRQRDEPTVTQAFSIQYSSADSVSRAIQGLLTPDLGRVTVNSSSNSLIVTDTRSSVDRVRELLPQLDTRTPQVDISAMIAFIDRTTLEAFGVLYDLKDSRGSQLNSLVSGYRDSDGDGVYSPSEATREDVVLLGGNSIAALGNANFRMPTPALEVVTTLVLGRHSLITFIEALQTVSLSDIQAKPVIRTMDHRLATIQVGEETPIRIIDAGATGAVGGTAQAPRATVEYKNTGVILEVTPHITGNQVLLDLRAERSNVAAAPSDIGVIFQTQNATTQVLVNDGETVVIAGLTIIEKSRSRAGIPFLMNLPVVGALFRTENVRENKRDLLIMVTPHIVRD